MRDRDLYASILGIEAPWSVVDVKLDQAGKKVEVFLEYSGERVCPECAVVGPGYDVRERRWRHLDTCQFQTILVAKVPRIDCKTHGPRQIRVPWAVASNAGCKRPHTEGNDIYGPFSFGIWNCDYELSKLRGG